MTEAYAVLDDLLNLLAHSTGAEAVELLLASDAGTFDLTCAIAERPPIGAWFGNALAPALHTDAQNQDVMCAAWVSSLVGVPISGPSAEVGWLVAAHSDAARFEPDTIGSLERVGRLVEHALDRELERVRFDELGLLIRSHQDDLRIAREQLELSNRELEQFAYIAAHELITPLRTVAIYAEVLATITAADPGVTKPALDYAREIRAGVTAMTEQVQYLLALSQTNQEVDILGPVSLTEIVQAAVDTLAVPLGEVEAMVTINSLPIVAARGVPLQSVFANLLTNAIRYRRRSAPLEIVISAISTPHGPRISVSDNGEGIDLADQTRVFEMFERASGQSDGSGIGLALSRRILDVFGAHIGVEANATVGSTFWLQFPRAGASVNEDRPLP